MKVREVAYLGPEGTYSHAVVIKRFGKGCRMVPQPTIMDVCKYVARHASRRGIIPMENSSGGAIYETVDILLSGKPRVKVYEELTLNVKLALLGRKGEKITSLYSHFAPMEHCESWIRQNLGKVRKEVVSSTAAAAQTAADSAGAVAIGNRSLAKMYGLQILEYPVQADIPNVTAFLAIGETPVEFRGSAKTALAVKLPNEPGSLCTLLEYFRDENVNLSRLISRPLRGTPNEYAFLVELEGRRDLSAVRRALAKARKTCVEVRVVGSYTIRRPYSS